MGFRGTAADLDRTERFGAVSSFGSMRAGIERAAHLRTFALPGSEKAVKEPRRSAIGMLHELYGEEFVEKSDFAPVQAFPASELKTIGEHVEVGVEFAANFECGQIVRRSRFPARCAADGPLRRPGGNGVGSARDCSGW